jgi:hypothetical protein
MAKISKVMNTVSYFMAKKWCWKCEAFKPASLKSFYSNKSRTDGLGGVCKVCQDGYNKKHYKENRPSYYERHATRQAELTAVVNGLKNNPCMDCRKRFNPWQMDFDHRPGEKKIADINRMIRKGNMQKLLDEIAKCDLVCANCHRDRTHQRRQAA